MSSPKPKTVTLREPDLSGRVTELLDEAKALARQANELRSQLNESRAREASLRNELAAMKRRCEDLAKAAGLAETSKSRGQRIQEHMGPIGKKGGLSYGEALARVDEEDQRAEQSITITGRQ